jgi:hypothetical protein
MAGEIGARTYLSLSHTQRRDKSLKRGTGNSFDSPVRTVSDLALAFSAIHSIGILANVVFGPAPAGRSGGVEAAAIAPVFCRS